MDNEKEENTSVGACSPAPVYSGQKSGPGQEFSREALAEACRYLAESGTVRIEGEHRTSWREWVGIIFEAIVITAAIVGAVMAIKIGIGG